MKWLAVFLVCGCAITPVLTPDETAHKLSDRVATTAAAGVRVTVSGDAWRGDPYDLDEVMTVVHVGVENGSGRPLRLSYRDFALLGDSGMRYSALAPLQGQPTLPTGRRDTTAPVLRLAEHRASPVHVAPRFRSRHFYVAPHFSYFYPGVPAWAAPFPYDPYAYGPYAWPGALPSADMLAEAIPEGVLEPGGRIDGFVYFQSVASREGRVRFELDLVDATTSQSMSRATVPMRVTLR